MAKIARKGPPKWAGCRYVIDQEVIPVAQKHGVPITSRKRGTILNGNVSSDHNLFNLTADAVDLGTFSGAALAHDIAKSLGISNYSTGNFNGYNITRNGATFRVQILWAVVNHFNHVHVGIKLIAGQYEVRDPKVKPGDTMRFGDKGPGVLALQKFLRKHGFFKKNWKFGNRFGVKTRRAVKRFQRDKFGKKGVDGVVGPFTWAELKKLPVKPQNPQPKPKPQTPQKPLKKPLFKGAKRTTWRGRRLIAKWEGFRAEPYNDPSNFATIGYGHLIARRPVTAEDKRKWGTITKKRGKELLKQDVKVFEQAVLRNVKPKLTRGQMDALTSFTFNLGEGALKSSTLLRLLNEGKLSKEEATKQFLRWVKAPDPNTGELITMQGLVNRRKEEAALFNKRY